MENPLTVLPIFGPSLIALLPQKPPFVLISTLETVSENHCVATFTFSETHVMCCKGQLSVGGLIENIAQTCAAKAGYESFLANQKIPLGFIGDVKDFICSRLPLAGEQLKTEITIENKIFDVSIIVGRVFVKEEEIASCRMKIFVEPEKEEMKVSDKA